MRAKCRYTAVAWTARRALFQLGAERVQIAQNRGAGFAALELGKALLEIVEQPCRVGARGAGAFGAGTTGAADAQRDHRNRALPPLSSAKPGSQAHGLKLMSPLSNRSSPKMPQPTIAAISPNLRMQ